MFREGVGWGTRTSPVQLLFKSTLRVKLFTRHRHPQQNERKQTLITETISKQVNSLLTRLILRQITLFHIFQPMSVVFFRACLMIFFLFFNISTAGTRLALVLHKALLSSRAGSSEIRGGWLVDAETADSSSASSHMDKVMVHRQDFCTSAGKILCITTYFKLVLRQPRVKQGLLSQHICINANTATILVP